MEKKYFEIKSEHLKLVKNMEVGWQDAEFGAPEIDPKRPYGNSDVYQDMLELFGLKEFEEGIYEFKLFGKRYLLGGEDEHNINLTNDKLIKVLFDLHKETEIVLQICLRTGKFETGKFECEKYSSDWVKVQNAV